MFLLIYMKFYLFSNKILNNLENLEFYYNDNLFLSYDLHKNIHHIFDILHPYLLCWEIYF